MFLLNSLKVWSDFSLYDYGSSDKHNGISFCIGFHSNWMWQRLKRMLNFHRALFMIRQQGMLRGGNWLYKWASGIKKDHIIRISEMSIQNIRHEYSSLQKLCTLWLLPSFFFFTACTKCLHCVPQRSTSYLLDLSRLLSLGILLRNGNVNWSVGLSTYMSTPNIGWIIGICKHSRYQVNESC